MREIKFRVWDVNLKTYTSEYKFIRGQLAKRVLCGKMSTTSSEEIIQQFTGLLDKNNKEIYEGDILKLANGVFEVKWKNAGWIGLKKDQIGDPGSLYYQWSVSFDHIRDKETKRIIESINKVEILGNIFENPELLND